MIESTLERIKRLNSESKNLVYEVTDDCWMHASLAILLICDETGLCTPKELTDFQIGSLVGEFFQKRIAHKKEGQND